MSISVFIVLPELTSCWKSISYTEFCVNFDITFEDLDELRFLKKKCLIHILLFTLFDCEQVFIAK